jgi:aryl-alcohol dehydrogenase-like predicted oxidoreductase
MRYVDIALPTPVSAIGLGTWQFGAREWGYGAGYGDREAPAIVKRALELGVTLFDTAEVYGPGRSERILGAALRAAGVDREQIFLATKIMPVVPVAGVVEQRAVASARRLGVQYLDLYQVHQPNPLTPDAVLMRAMSSLRQVGLVRHVGVSNYSLARWKGADRALTAAENGADGDSPSVSGVISNQVQYNLVNRGPEQDLIPFAAATGRMVIAYSPLAQGFLSARHTADAPPGALRRLNPLFLPENLSGAAELFGLLRDIATGHEATPAQIALAWVIRHGQVAAIPGASSVAQLESNVAAAQITLRPEEIAALSEVAARFRPVSGRRALAAMAKGLRSR